MRQRLLGLDILRGICAFMIAIYHFDIWSSSYTEISFNNILYKFGRHGVSMFYILSGFALAYVYSSKINKKSLINFYIKRFFRIYPLLWAVQIITIVGFIYNGNNIPNLEIILLNFSGFFGFSFEDISIATGSWSIGNEIFFYILFPLILYCLKSKGFLKIALYSLIVFLIIYFNFYEVNELDSLTNQWDSYVNSFNQLPLFFIGILLGSYYERIYHFSVSTYLIVLLFLSLIFLIIQTPNNNVSIVTGYWRIIFIILMSIIVFCTSKISINKKNIFSKIFVFLGDISYSVYLIHPIVYYSLILVYPSFNNQKIIFCLSGLLITVIISYISYNLIEKNFVKIGKKVSSSYNNISRRS